MSKTRPKCPPRIGYYYLGLKLPHLDVVSSSQQSVAFVVPCQSGHTALGFHPCRLNPPVLEAVSTNVILAVFLGNQRSRLKHHHLVGVSSSDLARIDGAVEARDLNVVMAHSWNNLHPLELGRENDNVASRSVSLKQKCIDM